MFVYVWEYRVKAERKDEYLRLYGPDGAWVQLFRKDPSYVRTELLEDHSDPYRFLTLDYWQSKEARDLFRSKFPAEFEEIDRQGETCTQSEQFIGDFECYGRPE